MNLRHAVFTFQNEQALSSLALPQLSPSTSRPVGQKRIYNLPESFTKGPNRIMLPKDHKNNSNVKIKVKTPRDLLKATLRVQKTRPASAPIRLGSVARYIYMIYTIYLNDTYVLNAWQFLNSSR